MFDIKPIRADRRRHKRKLGRKWHLVVMVLIAAGLVAAGAMTVYRSRRALAANSGVREEIQASQLLIRQNISQELKSSFAPPDETVVENLPDAKIRVSGWVDVVTETGIADRQNYSIVLFRNDAGDWVGEKISILPQM